jgi:putative methyltransferase (TIGR04325 family)
VEQPQYVKVGKECFENKQLRFYPTIIHCLSENEPNVAILSSVLQYLERPFQVLDELLGLRCDHIIIDRTPFWGGPIDRLCVQNVPPSIYPVSYPSWIFSRQEFLNQINEKGFEVFVEFDDQDSLDGPVDLIYKGMIIVRSLPEV